MLDTDVPGLMFQPMKLMALGQIHSTALFNRRAQAYAAWPYQVMSARSPTDLMHANVRFFQTALRDYADVMEHLADSWAGVVEGTAPPQKPERRNRDYLALSRDEIDRLDAGEESSAPQSGSEASGSGACAA